MSWSMKNRVGSTVFFNDDLGSLASKLQQVLLESYQAGQEARSIEVSDKLKSLLRA